MEQEARYYVYADLQGTDFGTNRDYTIEQWRGQALEWAYVDEHYGIMRELADLPKEQVLDYVAEFWALRFRKCRKDKKKFANADDKFLTYEDYKRNGDVEEE